ncbi:MAG: M48 family metallopeptidase [Desulfobacteraceae bacterium]|nr:M48 family metallopeptidase [Desulfobacteraceae bacterium]
MAGHSLSYGDKKIYFDVCYRSKKQGKIAIHVYPDGSVLVDAPEYAEPVAIREALRKRARWVVKHLDVIREQRSHVLQRRYISGESHFYLGRRYTLKVICDDAVVPQVKMIRGQLNVIVREKNFETIKKHLWLWYCDHANVFFQKRLREIVGQVSWFKGDTPPSLKLLQMKKQWGSCTPGGKLLLNPHLIKAPRECVEYVIIHELCHLKEHNHSARFYTLLEALMPNWKLVKNKLDGMAELLLNE